MNLPPDVSAQLRRLGEEVTVLEPTQTSRNDFGNPERTYESSRTTYAVRTYPNRNTTVEESAGDLARDKPVFVFPKGNDDPEPPQAEDHIVYNGEEYELQAPTHYETHMEIFGQLVRH